MVLMLLMVDTQSSISRIMMIILMMNFLLLLNKPHHHHHYDRLQLLTMWSDMLVLAAAVSFTDFEVGWETAAH